MTQLVAQLTSAKGFRLFMVVAVTLAVVLLVVFVLASNGGISSSINSGQQESAARKEAESYIVGAINSEGTNYDLERHKVYLAQDFDSAAYPEYGAEAMFSGWDWQSYDNAAVAILDIRRVSTEESFKICVLLKYEDGEWIQIEK